MKRHSVPIRATGLLAMAVATSLLSAPATADLNTWYESASRHGFSVTHLPDLDQRRDALANDGDFYCVPTSSINWMCYIANHGWPDVAPGPAPGPTYWANQTTYGAATFLIDLMGSVMATDPFTGTSGPDAFTGLKLWLRDKPFVIEDAWPTQRWTPPFETALQHGMDGSFVAVWIGWYVDGGGLSFRNGGHAVSLASAWRYDA
ncbi:MAG: hypothetical protein ACYTGC_04950, partial [Planctomycetota bacterium]